MNNKKLVQQGVMHAVLAFGYIAAVVVFMNSAEGMFGKAKNVFAPIGFLLLFVISAAVMGLLVFGKPVMFYFDGKKKEGLGLLAATIGSLVLIAIIFFVVLFSTR